MSLTNLSEINRVYSPSKFSTSDDPNAAERPSRPVSRAKSAKSAKSKTDSDQRITDSVQSFLPNSRSRTPDSSVNDSVEDYYPKSPLQNQNILTTINQKIAKLDEFLHDFRAMTVESRTSFYEPSRPISSTKVKQVAAVKERENKEIHQFAGIYAMKSVFYDTKTELPTSSSVKDDSSALNKPKLIELYQFPGYEADSLTPLPHNVKINDVLDKVLNSLVLLRKQPKYRVFLRKIFFTYQYKTMVHDVFWYTFLEKYQKSSHRTQQSLFERISKAYVQLLMMDHDILYKDTFFKTFANLLAMTVYTAFTMSFPESYTHFGHEFKEFICQICHLWINGNRPIPRSYLTWNYKMLDPPQAIFAAEVMTNKNNMLNFDNDLNERINEQHQQKDSMQSSRLHTKRLSNSISTLSYNKKSERMEKISEVPKVKKPKKESHVAGKGPQFENYLFDLYGHSPLVDCFMYKQNNRKLNTFETLVNHPSVVALPPLEGKTYDEIITESLKNTRKIEHSYKTLAEQHKKETKKLTNEHAKAMRTFKENEKILLSKNKEVKYLGDLISMEAKKDPNSTSVGAHVALLKALKIE